MDACDRDSIFGGLLSISNRLPLSAFSSDVKAAKTDFLHETVNHGYTKLGNEKELTSESNS